MAAFGIWGCVFGIWGKCNWYLRVCIFYLVPRGRIYHVRCVFPVAFVGGWLGCVSQFPKVQIWNLRSFHLIFWRNRRLGKRPPGQRRGKDLQIFLKDNQTNELCISRYLFKIQVNFSCSCYFWPLSLFWKMKDFLLSALACIRSIQVWKLSWQSFYDLTLLSAASAPSPGPIPNLF